MTPSASRAGRQAGREPAIAPGDRAEAAQAQPHLHDDVEGEVEQQVADADGQQVGGKVIGAHDEAVGSPAQGGSC